jgi:predicted enzyme related to lactoylglutathione lyase
MRAMESPVRWFEIYVADMHRAKVFYERTFGFHFSKMDTKSWDVEMWSISTTEDGKSFGCLTWRRDTEPSGISSVVYFGSEDCAIEERRAIESGGKLHRAKFGIGQYGFMSMIRDTEGNLVGVHSRR